MSNDEQGVKNQFKGINLLSSPEPLKQLCSLTQDTPWYPVENLPLCILKSSVTSSYNRWIYIYMDPPQNFPLALPSGNPIVAAYCFTHQDHGKMSKSQALSGTIFLIKGLLHQKEKGIVELKCWFNLDVFQTGGRGGGSSWFSVVVFYYEIPLSVPLYFPSTWT